MPSGGSAYARFRRALKTGNMVIIQAAARELPQVSLPDALSVCAVLADGPRERYERAAVRWLGRFCAERRPDLSELQRAVAALHLLPLQRETALQALQEVAGLPHPVAG